MVNVGVMYMFFYVGIYVDVFYYYDLCGVVSVDCDLVFYLGFCMVVDVCYFKECVEEVDVDWFVFVGVECVIF